MPFPCDGLTGFEVDSISQEGGFFRAVSVTTADDNIGSNFRDRINEPLGRIGS